MALKNLHDEKHKATVGNYFTSKTEYWNVVYDDDHQIGKSASHQRADMVLRQEITLSLIDKYTNSKSENILDIGCGTGVLLELLSKKGHSVTGIDISEGMLQETIKRIKRNHIKDAHCYKSEVESMPFEDGQFNFITCLGVLEYLSNDNTGLTEINRVLKKNGVLIISAPNLFKLKNVLDPYIYFVKGLKYLTKKKSNPYLQDEKLSEISTNENFANKRYSLRKIKKLFSDNGYEILSVHPIGFGPLTFFNKKILPLSTSLKLNDFINKLVKKNAPKLLNHLPNRWVFCLKKT